MLNLVLHVSPNLGAAYIEAVKDAINLCVRLDIAFVDFTFNGVHTLVSKDTNVEKAAERYLSHTTKGLNK